MLSTGIGELAVVAVVALTSLIGFALLARHGFGAVAVAILGVEIAVAMWTALRYRAAETDVDLFITGLTMFGAVLLVALSAAGWIAGLFWRRRATR